MSSVPTKDIKNGMPASVDKIITKVAKENGYDDFKVAVTALSSGGANYTGDLFAVDLLQGGKDTLHLFVKASNIPLSVRANIPVRSFYEHEIFVYTDLSDAFEALQAKHRVPEGQRFRLPKYYGSDLTEPHEVLVLENLSKQGYEVYDRCRSMDWAYAKAALEVLAKFHALSFALEIEDPELYDKLIRNKKDFRMDPVGNLEAQNAIFGNIKRMASVAVDQKYSEPVIQYVNNFKENFLKEFRPLKQSVLAHGDYRISNQMVKYDGGKLRSLMPLDYQTIYHGSPINDIMYLLFSGSDEAFRREHYEDYIQQYYYELARALAALHHRVHDVYPRALYLQHVREKLLYGLGVALSVLPIVLVEATAAPKISEMVGGKADGTPALSGNALYAERLNGIAADMRRWGVLDALR